MIAVRKRNDAAEVDRESEAEPALIGRVLCGKWRLERLLGVGGTSSVYQASHRNGRAVAIKILRRGLADRSCVRSRFLREGYIANRIQHPGTVSVLDDDVTDDGIVFMVMDLLRGHTLEEHCRRAGGHLVIGEALFFTDQLLDVLSAAHRAGVVHRDLKPSNVFITDDNRVKLLDFGIASLRELTAGFGQTRTGDLLGTPAYMAPEQARGKWSEVDARTDIWAVGAILFRMLSGGAVYARNNAQETVIAAATEAAPSLSTVNRDFPSALVELVDRALGFEPNQRWQSASEMRVAARALASEFDWSCAQRRASLDKTLSTLEEEPQGQYIDREGFRGARESTVSQSAVRRLSGSMGMVAVVCLVALLALKLLTKSESNPLGKPSAVSSERAELTAESGAVLAPFQAASDSVSSARAECTATGIATIAPPESTGSPGSASGVTSPKRLTRRVRTVEPVPATSAAHDGALSRLRVRELLDKRK